ncbi:Uncharacterised protein [uncultured archaeon]|nr:Uncharacterised protein [uncultured archaeon]
MVSAPTYADERQAVPNDTNPNGWGFFPRAIFGQSGFSIPFTWKGGDDFEIAYRLDRKGLRTWYRKGRIFHPMAGFTIYHRIASKGKYYPYASGIFRAMLFISEYDLKHAPKYCLWYVFYRFFALLLDEPELARIADASCIMRTYPKPDLTPNPNIAIVKSGGMEEYRTSGKGRYFFIPRSLLSLLISGECNVHDEKIVLLMPRWKFALRLAASVALVPVFSLLALSKLAVWRGERKKAIFPIMPADLGAAAGLVSKLCSEGRL